MRIGIIGGGSVGAALGRLLSKAGREVRVGVREGGIDGLQAVSIVEAAAFGEAVVLAVPFAALAEVLPSLRSTLPGKIVVDATNPVNADWSPTLLGEENSAGEEVARQLPGARVVKAFNTIFADNMRPERQLRDGGRRITAFVASDDAAAAETVAGLARDAGFDPVVTGALAHARHLEAIAHLNIALAATGGTDAAFLFDRTKA